MRNSKQKVKKRVCTCGAQAASEPTGPQRWATVLDAWRDVVFATLDLAEGAVRDFPEERMQIDTVRQLAVARFAKQPLPPFDPRHVAFTIGLIATLVESDFARPGLAALCIEAFSPAALAAYMEGIDG